MKSSVLYFGTEAPAPVVVEKRLGQKNYTINYDVEAVSEGEYTHRWKSAKLEPVVWNYGAIVSAIINQAYSQDEMQAIGNNYLLATSENDLSVEKEAEYVREFKEMCLVRDEAKRIAKELLAYAEENNL